MHYGRLRNLEPDSCCIYISNQLNSKCLDCCKLLFPCGTTHPFGATMHWQSQTLWSLGQQQRVVLYLCVCDVEGWNGLHVQLHGMLLGNLLGLVRPIEVLARHAALAAGHVPPDDEVRAAWYHMTSQPVYVSQGDRCLSHGVQQLPACSLDVNQGCKGPYNPRGAVPFAPASHRTAGASPYIL